MTTAPKRELRQIQELGEFLDQLDHRISALADVAKVLGRQGSHPPRFADYSQTRSLTSECLAFSIVIERRIDMLPEDKRDALQNRFNVLTVSIWSTLLDCSLSFLKAVSEEEYLPLGSREVFLQEIKTLYDADQILTNPRYEGIVREGTLRKQKSAERILNEIIDRAPRLLDLTAPSAAA